eukprot:m.343810 g.343810  ORF g.343810 m.343810 type:complete len:62 (+) comp20634_c6_seq2:55-240(+)
MFVVGLADNESTHGYITSNLVIVVFTQLQECAGIVWTTIRHANAHQHDSDTNPKAFVGAAL